MKFGIGFATSGKFSDPGLLAHLATTAECCGFESLWSVEHVAVPVKHLPYPGSKDGSMPGGDDVAIPDPLIPLAYVAAVTKTIKLATGILILPQRHPIYTAKEVATVDVLSGGRVILGIGSGWMKEEFEALGIDFHHRGAMTDEAIQALRATVRSEAQKAGRNPDAIEFSCLTRSLKPDDLKMLADMGVSRVVVNPPGTKPEVVTRGLEKFREEVISRV